MWEEIFYGNWFTWSQKWRSPMIGCLQDREPEKVVRWLVWSLRTREANSTACSMKPKDWQSSEGHWCVSWSPNAKKNLESDIQGQEIKRCPALEWGQMRVLFPSFTYFSQPGPQLIDVSHPQWKWVFLSQSTDWC